MPPLRGTTLAVASFLAFGALLVLYGANATELISFFAVDYEAFGRLGANLSLGIGSGILVAGPLIDRLPRRPLFLAACALVVAATTTLGSETTFDALLWHTFAIGFGAGFYETVLNAVIVEDFGAAAPRRLIFVHAAATFAASVTPLVFELVRSTSPLVWYDTFRIAGAIHVALFVSAFAVPMRRPIPKTGAEPSADRSGSGHDDRIALAAVCAACFAYVGVEAAVSLFVGDYTTTFLGLEAARGQRAISAFWGGLLVGRLAVGLSPRPVGAGPMGLLAGVAAALLFAFSFGAIPSPELAMAGVGFFLGGVFPTMIGLAGMALPSRAGTAVGLAGGLGSLGGFVIPWLTGGLFRLLGDPWPLASLALWIGLLVSSALLVARRHRDSA